MDNVVCKFFEQFDAYFTSSGLVAIFNICWATPLYVSYIGNLESTGNPSSSTLIR